MVTANESSGSISVSGTSDNRGTGSPRESHFAQPFEAQMLAARHGAQSAIGSILEECRNYLLLIANRELGQSIQAKIGASDLVQETFLQATQIFDRFEGTSRRELASWLGQILEHKLAQANRRILGTEKRDANREQPLPLASEFLLDARLPRNPTPSEAVASQEEREVLRLALLQLPAEYQLAIEMRGLKQQSFDELGKALNRSPDAARMIWARAIVRLRQELKNYGIR